MKHMSKKTISIISVFLLVVLFTSSAFATSYVSFNGSFRTRLWTNTLDMPNTYGTQGVNVNLSYTAGTTGWMRIRLIDDATQEVLDSTSVYGSAGSSYSKYFYLDGGRGKDVYLMFDFEGDTESSAWSVSGTFSPQ